MRSPVVRVERHAHRAVGVGRVARGHAVIVEQRVVARLRERGARAEVGPEFFEAAAVVVAERAHGVAEASARSRGRTSRRRRAWPSRRRRRGASSARPSRRSRRSICPVERAVITRRLRAVFRVDERDDVVAQIRHVLPGAGRVDVLAAAERRPCVDHHDEARWHVVLFENSSSTSSNHVRPKRRAIAPHVDLAGETLNQIDGRKPLRGIALVRRRAIHPERPHMPDRPG